MAELVSGGVSVISGGVGKLLGRLWALGEQELALAWNLEDDLEWLEGTFASIEAVLLDAEKKHVNNNRFHVWLGQLKIVLNDAENVLDEFERQVLQSQADKTRWGRISNKLRRLFSRFEMGHKIKDIRKRLESIDRRKTQFALAEGLYGSRVAHTGEITDSFLRASEVFGRETDKDDIINDLLRQPDPGSSRNVSTIAIVGIGGLGKTTLAKFVFNDPRIAQNFVRRMWVHVSADFDLNQLMIKILKSAGDQDCDNLDPVQSRERIRQKLIEKFFLVLDDVWNEDQMRWTQLEELLAGGATGSRILVTTRSTSTASIGTLITKQLNTLPYEDCLSLFKKMAFRGEADPRLVETGGEIVRLRCGGLPLAVKTLACLLYSKTDEQDWLFVRDNEIWQLPQKEGDILHALKLSYDMMPSDLKQCFSLLSLFPKNFQCESSIVVQIWMALGLLESCNPNQDFEDVGNQYIKELCSRSLLQVSDVGMSYFTLHDLVHDLIRSVTHNECSVINERSKVIRGNVRHLSFYSYSDSGIQNVIRSTNKLKKYLHTVYFPGLRQYNANVSQQFVEHCLSNFKYLRFLDASNTLIEELPSSIGKLKHLRYLDLSFSKRLKKIHNSICKLQHLQTLLLIECWELEEIPKDISNVISLRTLSLTTKQAHPVHGRVGSWISLRHMEFYNCGKMEYLFQGQQQLELLQTLTIKYCTSLISLTSSLKLLPALKNLVIHECHNLDLETEEVPDQSLEFIQLQKLEISGLPKLMSLPQWLQRSAPNLQQLQLRSCSALKKLPNWFPKLTSLKEIVFHDCPALTSLPPGMHQMSRLQRLRIKECKDLSEYCTRQDLRANWPLLDSILETFT